MKARVYAGLVSVAGVVLVLGAGCGEKHSTNGSGNLPGSNYSITVTNDTETHEDPIIFQQPVGLLGATSYNLNVINNSTTFQNFDIYQRSPDLGYSSSAQSKDVDLQRADLQQAQLEDRAEAMASQFGMSLGAARQLTVIADRMSKLGSAPNGLSDADREALADAALQVVGIQAEDVNAAIAKMIKTGDQSSINELVARAATNLGMSSPTALREQILPSLGIQLGK